MNADGKPLVFISYSWTPEQFADQVKEIAIRLVRDGIDVKFDRWDNIPGNELYEYMEQSVNNPEVDFVLIMCTEEYTRKANDRDSGVGVETQIIAPHVYNNSDQDKFVPVILEKDSAGKPCTPTFVETRIHIDLSEDTHFEDEYETLVRTIYRKPLDVKPKLGKPPAYITSDNIGNFQSLPKFRAFENALKNGKITTLEYFHDFRDAYVEDLKLLEIAKSEIEALSQEETETKIVTKINESAAFTPMYEQLAKDMALYWDKIGKEEILLFIESFLSYSVMQRDYYRFETSDRDPRPQILEYLLYEFMLIFCTYLIMNQRYQELDLLFSRQYQVLYYSRMYSDTVTGNYSIRIFNNCPHTLSGRIGHECKQARVRLRDYVSSRLSVLNVSELVETDFILSLISFIQRDKKTNSAIWAAFITPTPPKLRLFHLMESRTRFDKAKTMFHIDEPDELDQYCYKLYNHLWWGQDIALYDTFNRFGMIP